MSEAASITAELLIEIPKRFPGARCWRNNRVDAVVTGRGGRPRHISAGINGQADITGILPPNGQRLEIEIKAGRDRQSQDQKSFEAMILAAGGIYLVARDTWKTLDELAVIVGGL